MQKVEPIKKGFNPQDFETRADKVKKMAIPFSDPSRIIVKPNNMALGFRLDCYEPELLGNTIKKEEFLKTVREANKIIEEGWVQKRLQETAQRTKPQQKMLIVAVVLICISFIIMAIIVYDQENNSLLAAAAGLLALAMVATTVAVLSSMLSHPKFLNVYQQMAKDLQAFLAQENKGFYAKKYFEWKMGTDFYWLELHNNGIKPSDNSIDLPEDRITIEKINYLVNKRD